MAKYSVVFEVESDMDEVELEAAIMNNMDDPDTKVEDGSVLVTNIDDLEGVEEED